MDGFFPIFFLMVILKIPVAALLYLVWWAFHANTLPEEAPPEPEDHRFRRFRREPKLARASAISFAAAVTGPRRCRSPIARREPAPTCSRRRRSPAPHIAASALAPEIDLKALPGVAAPEGPGPALQPPAAWQITLELL